MSNFTAYAMPCTQEQFEKDLEPTLKRWGVDTSTFSHWTVCNGISNYINGVDKMCGSFDMSWRTDEQVIPYNPAKFLDSLFPERWCVRDTEGSTIFLRKLCKEKGWDENWYLNDYYYKSGVFYLDSENTIQWIEYKIPTNYTEVTLEELVYHYEQPKEEVMKKEEPKIRVKITSTDNNRNWYKIGEEYDVKEDGVGFYRFNINSCIYKRHCTIIKAPKYNLTITRAQLKDIYDIACSRWKEKIKEYAARINFETDLITFTEKEVETMFEAAVNDQPKVLERIFGNPRIAELKARKEELEAELEGINKELNI